MNLQVERFPAIARGGGLGCSYSHRNVIALAKERGYPHVIVFEDDFEFLISRDTLDTILASLPEDFDVVMLSYYVQGSEPYNDQFGRVLEVQTASGYIVSSKFYDTLLNTWNKSLEDFEKQPHCHWLFMNDQSWKPIQPISRWYYSLVRVGKQRAGWSDLAQSHVDYGV
jgi:hypothetical protein